MLFRIVCLLLVGMCAGLTWLSYLFGYDRSVLEQPVIFMVILEMAAGAAFLLLVREVVWKQRNGKRELRWILGVGLVMRALMMFSTPMLEHDFYRYLWDGSVLANGMNPFRVVPEQVLAHRDSVAPELSKLARESEQVLPRVSHSQLRTIYPPVAQAMFAVAYMLRPWSLMAWRCVLAVFDAAVVILLVMILRNLDLPLTWIVTYWCNPLVVRETFNTAHMDVVALPFPLAAVMLALRERHLAAGAFLALATASKLWPLVLFPAILSSLWPHGRRILACVGVFSVLLGIVLLPVAFSTLDDTSGFVAYAGQWEMNDSLYRVLSWGVQSLSAALSFEPDRHRIFTRALAAVILSLWIGWVTLHRDRDNSPESRWERHRGSAAKQPSCRRKVQDAPMVDKATVVPNATRVMKPLGSSTSSRPLHIHQAQSRLKPGEPLLSWQFRSVPRSAFQLWERSLLIVSAVFLLSPTGFPWYFLWVVPFLAIRPRPSLLLLNCLLPLYYLSFYFRAHETPGIFDNVITLPEYLPVLLVMGCEWVASAYGGSRG